MPPQGQFGFQPQQPGPHPTQWWFDGRKWRPPVGQGPTRMQLAAQIPGMLIKLIFLVVFLAIILAAFGIIK
jgi:hypothetical protein